MKYFAPWFSGLAQDQEAIEYISRSNMISGVELNHHENDDLVTFEKFGIPTIFHTPGHKLIGNLCAENFHDQLSSDEFMRVLHVAKQSSMNLLAFHLGYSASEVYKMRGHPNIPAAGAKIYDDHKELMEKIIANATDLIDKFSGALGHGHVFLFEGLDSSDSIEINWEIQSKLAIKNKNHINNFVKTKNSNAALSYLTDPEFMAEFIDRLQLKCKSDVGILLDIAHTWISSTSHANRCNIKPDSRFDQYTELLSGKIKQIHINRPGGHGREYLTDAHQLLKGSANDSVSSDIYKCWKKIKKEIDDSVVVTIEVAKPANMSSKVFLGEIEKQIVALESC